MSLLALLASVLDQTAPLALAALGGVISERAGVSAIGLEGMMRVGAFFAMWAAHAAGNPWAGLAGGAAAGAAFASIHAWLCIRWRADQVVSGIALNLVALGSVTYLLESFFGSVSAAPQAALPSLPRLAGLDPVVALALALPFAGALLLGRTAAGLRLRAAGEHPRALAAAGVRVDRVRWAAVATCGVLAGLGGADLPVGLLHRFDNRMPSGLGFMALAAIVFGRWRPLGALGASLFFAAGSAASDALRSRLPAGARSVDGIVSALPYALTLVVLAGLVGRARAPAALGATPDAEPGS